MFNLRIRYLSFFFGLIAILSFFNVVYSYYLNLYLNLNTYYSSLISSLLIALAFYKFEKKKTKISIFDKILTVFFGYITIPLVLSLPFYLSIYNLSFLNSFFESVSGFTSTGFTIFENIKHIDQSLILWRSSIQWIGGLYFLFSIIFLIDIYDDSLKKSLTNFLSFNSAEILKQTIKIFILYSSLTLGIFITLNLFNIRTFNSLNLAMTLISSGGFLPTNNLSNILTNNTQIIVFSLLMLTSFFSIFLSYNLIFFKNRNLDFFYEDLHLFFYLLFVSVLFFFFFNFQNNFNELFLSLISSISNIGVSLDNNPKQLSFIFFILVIIGGSFFSTSSGIRFLKLYSLFKYSINEILSHSRPKNIYIKKIFFTKINFEQSEIYKYFLSILVFVLSLFVLSSLLSISGFSMEVSFKLSILTFVLKEF